MKTVRGYLDDFQTLVAHFEKRRQYKGKVNFIPVFVIEHHHDEVKFKGKMVQFCKGGKA